MEDKIKGDIEKATVILPQKGGLGVLVNGGLILTAAHCVKFELNGRMEEGQPYIEKLKTTKGELSVQVHAVDLVSGMAVLGPVNEIVKGFFSKDNKRFRSLCNKTKLVSVYRGSVEQLNGSPIHIYTHKGTWITGKISPHSPEGHLLWIACDGKIEDGTSGGPIVNESGELVAIVSVSGGFNTARYIIAPCPHLTLPTWVIHKIFNEEVGGGNFS